MWDIFKKKTLQWYFTEWEDCEANVSVKTVTHFWDSEREECTEIIKQEEEDISR